MNIGYTALMITGWYTNWWIYFLNDWQVYNAKYLLWALDNDPGCMSPDFCGIPPEGRASFEPPGVLIPEGRGKLIWN